MSLTPPAEDQTFAKLKQEAMTRLKRLLKRTEKQILKCQEHLLACHNWTSVHHAAELLQSNLYRLKRGMRAITVEDWEEEGTTRTLELDPLIDPKIHTASLFRKAKKLRLGTPHAQKQLNLILEAKASQEDLLASLENIVSLDALNAFFIEHPITGPQKKPQRDLGKKETPKPYRVYYSASGTPIWVGKSAKNNDQLTFHHARGSDWWLHAHDYPGSHVVIHSDKKGEEPDAETVRDAAELALRFSKAEKVCREGSVTISQVKFLNRLKNNPGKVQVSKHKIMHIHQDQVRWNRLKNPTST